MDDISETIRYDPKTGKFWWLPNPKKPKTWLNRFAFNEAFTTVDIQGYLYGRVSYKRYIAHRVAWYLHYGHWPVGQIDHINGNIKDNRIENLRDVTISQNQWNRKLNANNTSGYKGVCWSKKDGTWVSHITLNGKVKRLGCFSSKEEAAKAYSEAADKLHEGYCRK